MVRVPAQRIGGYISLVPRERGVQAEPRRHYQDHTDRNGWAQGYPGSHLCAFSEWSFAYERRHVPTKSGDQRRSK